MPNMEELLNQVSVEITRDRTVQLFLSKIDLDYAYGQMKLSEETSRQCVFALTGGKFQWTLQIQKRVLRTCRYTHHISKKVTELSNTAHRQGWTI